MRVDYEKREIVCSVGDLVHESTYRRIGVERGDGFRRMWIGQDIHTRRAELRANEDPHYRAEVHVVHRTTIGGWSVTITGRIDGLSVDKDAKRVSIEEVKSLHFDLELEALYRSEKLQRHLYQLLLYAYFLCEQPDFADFVFAPQLVLIDLVSGDTKLVDAEFDRARMRETLEASLAKLVENLETAAALRAAKQAFASALQFPFDGMRPGQDEIVSAVARGIWQRDALLISAPTGIGKTMAVLYPAIRQSLKLGKKLFFLTSKTLQQEAAVAALRMLNDGSFRVLRIRSKQKMCAHTEMICHEDFCPFAAKYGEKMQQSGLLTHLVTAMSYFDPDITFELARESEVCPFEVSLELIEQADVIVCDYNYIFDPYVGLKAYSQENDYGDCVLVVDEAHNLVDRGRGYYSPELHESQFDEIKRLMMSRNCWIEGWEDLLEILRAHFLELADVLEDDVKQALCSPSRELFLEQRVEWERIVLEYIGWKIDNRIAEEDDPLIDFYFKLVKFTNLLAEEGDEFAHLIERTQSKDGSDGLKLKIFCKDPSRFLGQIFDSAHATVALSATLEPFDFYRKTLGFPQQRTAELAVASPFPRTNRKIVVVPEVDTTYKRRAEHFDRIAETVADIADAGNGNFLALFPSYAFLREIVDRMPPTQKNVMVQRTDMTDYERNAILEILRDRPRKGNLILAVSGGMYAEGIDYQGDMLSGVMVVGPALPQVSFEQELLKQYYDEQYGAGFEFAYLIPGMTRVVQSAGRVIRSETDIGVIALLCKRFTQETYTRYFPTDWYEESPRELVSKKPASEIRSFFEAKATPQLRMLF
ncbi:MAG: ATP-dependent DNA helicase [Acidobacteria bacterium]|nr:ATP-dependent DNA helicase [Acidobacteriota bacterium]MBV9476055.1 ATP-dependent DNA helicase [Acidobacteriota bacterium]